MGRGRRGRPTHGARQGHTQMRRDVHGGAHPGCRRREDSAAGVSTLGLTRPEIRARWARPWHRPPQP